MKRTVPRMGSKAALDVARGELIGLRVTVAESTDGGLVGLTGVIVDETLRTFVVRRDDGRESRIGKRGQVFEFASPGGPLRIDGAGIEFRPAERTKKVR